MQRYDFLWNMQNTLIVQAVRKSEKNQAWLKQTVTVVSAAILRDGQLVPYHRQAHGREDIGDNPPGTGHAGIRPRQPDVHSPEEDDSSRRRGMMMTI